ncbi:MAG: hypothetical protein Q8N77_05125 [Nanoarchaeota archaeon]|nr:hypothetical protein [Nanoarchaeota archaeon]
MSKLELILDKEVYKPGEKVEGSLLLDLKKDTKVRDVVISVYGNERTHITRTHGSGKNQHTVTYTEDVEVIDEPQSLIGQFDKTYQLNPYDKGKNIVLPSGQHNFKFSFQLPNDATPTYDGEHAEVKYELSAKVDIPWRLDIKQGKEIHILPKDASSEKGVSALIKEKSGSSVLPQALSPDIDMAVHLSKTELTRGEYLEGKVAVTNKSGKTIRNLKLELYANEHAEAEGYTEDSAVMNRSETIPVSQPELNYFEQNFKFQIPTGIMPTMQREYFNIEWHFKIGLDVAKAADLETEADITIK